MWVIAAIYAFVLAFASIRRHLHFHTGGYDLGIFDQGVWLLAQGSRPFVTVRGRDLFADHFQLVLAVFAPLAALDLTPGALLIIQSATLAAAAPLLFELARLRGASPRLSLVVATLWLASPLTQWTNLFDFHPETAVPPLLVCGAIALETGHRARFVVLAAAACMFKEDIAIVFIVWGGIIACRGMRQFGIGVATASALLAVLVTQVVIPASGGNFDFYTARFGGDRGSTWPDIVAAIVGDPQRTINDLATPANAKILLALVLVTGGLAVFSPLMVLPAVPAIAMNLLSAYSYQHEIAFHYHLIPAAFFAIASAYGAGAVEARRRRWVQPATASVFAVAILVAVLGPASQEVRRQPDPSQGARQKAIRLIPPGAAVAAAPLLVPHLTHRREIYQLPQPFVSRPHNGESWSRAELRRRAKRVKWVVYELRGLDPWPRQQTAQLPRQLRMRGFKQVFAEQGVRVFHRAT